MVYRSIIDPLEQMRDFDFVSFEHDVMVGLGVLVQDLMSQLSTPVVAGFAASQTSPQSLSVVIGPGRIYALTQADAAAAGSIPQDTSLVVQQGINVGQTLTFVAPSVGQSQWNLVQVQFQQGDAVRVNDPNGGLVPFYNASNPTVPNYASINTVRQSNAIIQVIQGVAATTGSEAPPQATSGWTPLYLIDLAGGQTAISTAQVLKTGPSIGTGVPNNYAVAPFIAGLQASHHNGIPGQAPKIDLTREVSNILPYANMSPVRTLLFGNLTVYVDPANGNDLNKGLSPGSPFKTINAAINLVYHSYDFNGFTATISVANGTDTTGVYVNGSFVGQGATPLFIVGNNASPGSCVINVADGVAAQAWFGANVQITGVTILAGGTGQHGYGLRALAGSLLQFGSVAFGACGNAHIGASGCGETFALPGSAYTVTGSSPMHLSADASGIVSIIGAAVTFSGSPAFSTAVAYSGRSGSLQANGATFSGTPTGQRYLAQLNGTIQTGTTNVSFPSGDPNFFPGTVAGVLQTGGQYA